MAQPFGREIIGTTPDEFRFSVKLPKQITHVRGPADIEDRLDQFIEEVSGLKNKLGTILGRGFNVKIPQKIFKPITLPAGVSKSLEVQGIQLALQVKPTGVMVARDRLWYGADLSLASKRAKSRP